ncbi:MAG: DNA polymerase III subunit delta [Novosphingobium sp.]|nr:DNA polymerase III subunit delta [Novosphingobium sp.]
MKATQSNFAGVAAKAARQCRFFFFCGPDEAGAAAAAARIVSLIENTGERVEMQGAELRRDPARLSDEAHSNSLFGDSRHIYVRASGDEAHDALAALLESEVESCPVLVVATSATDKSRTAKLLEGQANALVAMFYPPDLASVSGSVRQMADSVGLQVTGDLAERIARAAALDVRLAQSEVTKLAVYLDASPQSPRRATTEDIDAIGAQTENDGFMPLVNAVLSGKTGHLSGELARMRDLSMNPVGLLLAFERRVAQLAQLSAELGNSPDIRGLLERESKARRVFFRDKDDLATQMRCWRGVKLERLVERLVKLHETLLSGSQSAEIVLSQGLTQIARAAAPRR